MTTEEAVIFKFKINGIEIASDRSQLNADEILQLAEANHAIPGAPGEYMILGERGEYRGVEEIDIVIEDLLISIPTGPTPVA